jgi:hypothetical protein
MAVHLTLYHEEPILYYIPHCLVEYSPLLSIMPFTGSAAFLMLSICTLAALSSASRQLSVTVAVGGPLTVDLVITNTGTESVWLLAQGSPLDGFSLGGSVAVTCDGMYIVLICWSQSGTIAPASLTNIPHHTMPIEW